MKKRMTSLLVLSALVLSLVSLAACGGQNSAATPAPAATPTPAAGAPAATPAPGGSDGDVVKIGTPTYLTGTQGFTGNEAVAGIRLAIEQKQTLWGKPIQYVPVDGVDNSKMPSAAEYLLNVENVKLFIMGSNGVPGAMQQVIQPAGGFQVEVTGWDPAVLEGGWENTVQYTQMYDQFVDNSLDVVLDYLASKLGKTKEDVRVGAIVTTFWQPMADIIQNGMDKRGVSLAMLEVYPDDINDFTALIAKMKASNLDILIHVARANDTALFLKQTYAQQYRPPIVVAEGLGYDQPEYKDLKEAGEGLLCFSWPSPSMDPDKQPNLKEFIDDYEALIGRAPLTHSMQAYSGAVIALEAFEQAGSDDPEKIKEAFASIEYERGELPGLWGFKMAQDEGSSAYNERATDLLLNQWQMENGELVYKCIYPADVSVAPDDQVPFDFFK